MKNTNRRGKVGRPRGQARAIAACPEANAQVDDLLRTRAGQRKSEIADGLRESESE
jgi:hypothetical protein